jgi:hypothetical protein
MRAYSLELLDFIMVNDFITLNFLQEIHHELCEVYNQNVMSGGTVRRWCRMFKDGQTNFTMKSEVADYL